MTADPAGSPRTTWPAAAADLARRVTRRAQAGAVLPGVAAGMATGAGLAILATASGWGPPGSAVAWGLPPTALGMILGVRARARVRPTDRGDAAWALDRLAAAEERGLTAAVATGPAAAEAAWAGSPLAPPVARLRPPVGLVGLLAASLLVVVAALWPAPAPAAGWKVVPGPGRRRAAAAVDARDAARAEAAARGAERAAAAERDLREALGLPAAARPDAAEVLARLATPEALASARSAAPPGSDLASALSGSDPAAAAAAVAAALAAGAGERAASLRREGAELRASAGVVPVPPARRALVERWLAARLAAAPTGGVR